MPITVWVGDIITLSPHQANEIQCAIMVSQTKRVNFTLDREKGITNIDLNITEGVPDTITSLLRPEEYKECIQAGLSALQKIARHAFRCGQIYGELLAG